MKLYYLRCVVLVVFCFLCVQVKVEAAEADLPIRVKIISYTEAAKICAHEAPSWCPSHLLKSNDVQVPAYASRRDPLPEKPNDVNSTIKAQDNFLIESEKE